MRRGIRLLRGVCEYPLGGVVSWVLITGNRYLAGDLIRLLRRAEKEYER